MTYDTDGEQGSSSRKHSRRRFIQTTAIGAAAGLAGCAGGGGGGGGGGGDGDDGGDTDTGGSSDNAETTASTTNGASDLADELTVLTWGGSYGQKQKEVFIDSFQEEYDVDVTWGQFGSDWDLLTKQRTGGTEVDVAQPGQTAAYLGGRQDLLLPLRLDNFEYWDNLRDRFKNPTYDPGEDENYVAGLCYGGNGAVYNTDYLDEPGSWDDIYTEETKGQVALPSSIDSVVGIIGSDAGIDAANLSENYEEKMNQVWDLAEKRNEYIFQWWDSGSTMQQLLTNESAIAGQLWIGRVYVLRTEEDVPVEYTVPEEGTTFWTDSYGVASSTERRYTAEKFIDHTLRTDLSEQFAAEIPYAPCVPLDNPPKALEGNSDIEHLDRLQLLHPQLAEENRQSWEQSFQNIVRG
jgi:spermidine/putrescine-binding protein